MKYLILFLVITILITISLVSAYTPPTSHQVNLVLDTGYTAPDAHNINLVLSDVITDTCTCAGLNQDWEIDHADACNIIDNCDLGTGKLSFTGIGTTRCGATIDTSDLGDPGATGTLQIDAACIINID